MELKSSDNLCTRAPKIIHWRSIFRFTYIWKSHLHFFLSQSKKILQMRLTFIKSLPRLDIKFAVVKEFARNFHFCIFKIVQ